MNEAKLLTRAIDLANDVHRKQQDKAGNPYILHVMRVMLRCTTLEEMIVAVLHDVIEDSDLNLDDLVELGLPDYILYAIDCLTRRDDQSYMDHIELCESSALARTVKMADLDDHLVNYDPKVISAEHAIRYSKAWRYLDRAE